MRERHFDEAGAESRQNYKHTLEKRDDECNNQYNNDPNAKDQKAFTEYTKSVSPESFFGWYRLGSNSDNEFNYVSQKFHSGSPVTAKDRQGCVIIPKIP